MESLTRDVHAATVYSQTWVYRPNGNSIGRDVLALDVEMAEVMGGIELANGGQHLLDWTLTQNEPRPHASEARKLAILSHEDAECAELRESAYRDQEPSADQDAVTGQGRY